MCSYKGLFTVSHRWQPACCESHPGNYFASFKVQCGITLLNLNQWKWPDYHSKPVVLQNQQQGKESILLALYGPTWMQYKQINKTKTIKNSTPNKKNAQAWQDLSVRLDSSILYALPIHLSGSCFLIINFANSASTLRQTLHSSFDKAQKRNLGV